METLRTAFLIWRTHVFRMMRSRRMLIMLGLAAVPAAPVFLLSRARAWIDPLDLLTHVSWIVHLQIVLPLVCLIGGSAVVAEEIADRTIGYVFTRPVSRPGFFVGRWLAALSSILPVLALGVLLLFGLARHRDLALTGLGSDLFRLVLLTTLVGAAVYSTVFAALGAWVRHPMVIGIAYGFALEALFANLPGQTMKLAIQHHLRCLLVGRGGPEWEQLSELTMVAVEPPEEAAQTLVVALVVALALGCWFIRRRQIP